MLGFFFIGHVIGQAVAFDPLGVIGQGSGRFRSTPGCNWSRFWAVKLDSLGVIGRGSGRLS